MRAPQGPTVVVQAGGSNDESVGGQSGGCASPVGGLAMAVLSVIVVLGQT